MEQRVWIKLQQQQCVKTYFNFIKIHIVLCEHSVVQVKTLTPAVVKQEVNFLESSEISLHRTTVNLRTHNMKPAAVSRSADKTGLTSSVCKVAAASSHCDRTPASVPPLEKRIISASLWNSSMDRAVSSARLLMAAACTS